MLQLFKSQTALNVFALVFYVKNSSIFQQKKIQVIAQYYLQQQKQDVVAPLVTNHLRGILHPLAKPTYFPTPSVYHHNFLTRVE